MEDFINQVTLLAAGAVTIAVQILKLKIVPVGFANRHPVPTNIAISVIATVVSTNLLDVTWSLANWTDILGIFGTIAVVSALTYNQLLKNWPELRASEGEPDHYQR